MVNISSISRSNTAVFITIVYQTGVMNKFHLKIVMLFMGMDYRLHYFRW